MKTKEELIDEMLSDIHMLNNYTDLLESIDFTLNIDSLKFSIFQVLSFLDYEIKALSKKYKELKETIKDE